MAQPVELADLIVQTIRTTVSEAGSATGYREPLVGCVAADDPRFPDLRQIIHPSTMMPDDLLPGARTVISYFLPFEPGVVIANEKHPVDVAEEWIIAYIETNRLLSIIADRLTAVLADRGVRAAAEPPTYNFDEELLFSRWSHKSIGVLAGLGSFGLHHVVITDAGCAGRFGSLVIDAPLPITPVELRERCLYFVDQSCTDCIYKCPVQALDEANCSIDKQACWVRLQEVGQQYRHLGLADACGKCLTGPCAIESPV